MLFRSPDWQTDVGNRYQLRTKLLEVLDGSRTYAETCTRITRSWGGIKQPLPTCLEVPIRRTLGELRERPERIPERGCGERIASVSRLYACLDPGRWVVLDSRVSSGLAALLWLADHHGGWTEHVGIVETRHLARQRPVPGFRRLWPSSRAEAFRTFMMTSWACQSLAGLISCRESEPGGDPDSPWQACHVELVLARIGSGPMPLGVSGAVPDFSSETG